MEAREQRRLAPAGRCQLSEHVWTSNTEWKQLIEQRVSFPRAALARDVLPSITVVLNWAAGLSE